MAGLGLQGAFGVQGAYNTLDKLLAERAAARMYQDKLAQQEFENVRAIAREGMQQRTIDQNEQLRRDQLQMQQDAQRQNAAHQLVSELSPNQSIDEQTAGTLRSAGRGALIQANPEPAGQGFLLSGPVFQPGSQPGMVFRGTAQQRDQVADNDRVARQFDATQARQGALDERAAKHEGVMERIAQQNANANSQARDLAAQMSELKLQSERDKMDRAATERTNAAENARSVTQTALELADRLEKHPGFGMATGNISSRFSGFSQDATDANAIRDQLVAALTLPNLGALKGPMSDKDILFVKQLATRLGNPRISEGEAKSAIGEAKNFLRNKLGQGGVAPMPSHGGEAARPSAADLIKKYGG